MKLTKEMIAEYGLYYLAKGYRESTVRDMVSDMRTFSKYLKMKNITNIEEISHKIINKYTQHLKMVKTPKTSMYFGEREFISPKTIQGKILAVKSFLRYCNFVLNIGIDYSKVEIPKCPVPKMSFLDEQEMDILLDYIREREKNEEMKLRNYIFVKLAYVSGMRLSEMLKIKVSDILDNSGFEITIIGKGDKIRPVYFNQEIKNLTEEYVRFRNEKTIISAWSGHARKMQGSGELLFIRHDDYGFGKGISKSTISGMFKKYREEIDFKKRVSCHTIRHSFGTRVVRKTDNVRIAQELLGHSSIISTQRYTHITNRELFTAHKRIFMD